MRGIRVTNMTDEEKKKIASMMADEHMDEFIKRFCEAVYEAVTIITSDTIHEGCTYEITVPVTLRVRGERLMDMIKHVKGVYIDFD